MHDENKPPMFDLKDNGHTFIFAPTRLGKSVDYSLLGLTPAEVAEIKIVHPVADWPTNGDLN